MDLLNANDILSISVNENRLREVIMGMMAKLNQHSTRIFKAENNLRSLQDNTEKSIYSVQQRIQFNEKETDQHLTKLKEVISSHKTSQDLIGIILKQEISTR